MEVTVIDDAIGMCQKEPLCHIKATPNTIRVTPRIDPTVYLQSTSNATKIADLNMLLTTSKFDDLIQEKCRVKQKQCNIVIKTISLLLPNSHIIIILIRN